ncbi:hypothetical protein GCM10027578_07270 [Spirosoma luteolum]|jgi:hypothetical protein
MKALIKPLLVATILVSSVAASFATAKPITKPEKPAKPATVYQSGMYTAADGRLVVMLNKQAGSKVSVSVKNAAGTSLVTEYMPKRENKACLKFDLSQLQDGTYTVEITNGSEVTQRQVTLSTKQVAESSRQLIIDQQ